MIHVAELLGSALVVAWILVIFAALFVLAYVWIRADIRAAKIRRRPPHGQVIAFRPSCSARSRRRRRSA